MNALGFGMPGGFEILAIFFIMPVVFALPTIAFWKICAKAGFPGPLGLLMLVPLANIVLPLYIAFVEWPSLSGRGPSSSGQA